MRDSMSNILRIEIFYVHFYAPNGSVRYMIGMREYADTPVAPLQDLRCKPSRHDTGRSRSSTRLRSPVQGTSSSGPRGPPSSEASDLSAPSEPESQNAASEQSPRATPARNRRLLTPFKRETSIRAKDLTVLEAISKWSIPAKLPLDCCQFHCATAELRKSLQRLNTWKCSSTFRPIGYMQCEVCGLVEDCDEDNEGGEAAQVCSICDSETMVLQSHKVQI